MLKARHFDTNKTKKGSKKSEKQQNKMAGTVNKDSGGSNNVPASNVNKMNNSHLTMNGLPQYGGGGGIKRPPPEDDIKPLDNCVDPAKRLNLDPGIKCESPPSASDGNFNNHDFGKYSDNKSDIVGKVEPKEELLNFKDDSLGDLDGIMNNDTFNDLMSDLNIPNDFIDQFEFNDKNALEDLGNVIGSELGSGAGLDDKDDSFLQQSVESPTSNMGSSNCGGRSNQMSASSYGNNDIQQQQQQQGGSMNPMDTNAAERLKIMAQQHQQHQSTPPVPGMGMGPSGMGPGRMGGGPPMQGQQANMYHANMQQQLQQQQQQQQQQPNSQHQMGGGPNPMSNGHMMGGNLPPGGMPMSQQQGMHPGMRQGPPPPGSLPNLPTMPLPQSMPSPMMTCGSMTTSTPSPAMSNMSAVQMQQQQQQQQQQQLHQQQQQQAQMANMQHGGSMQHGMPNGPMGHNPAMGPGPGPGGGMHPGMYNNVPHNSMMDPAMVRMRAQGRYRLGTPNPNAMPNNMRPGMPMSGGGPPVMPGQSSPMGAGMVQPQVMSNQNMRQQVSTIFIEELTP
jgi:hypothetical protein